MGALPGGLSDMKAKRLLRKLNYLPRWAWYLASLCVGGPIGPVAVYLVFHVLEKAAADEIEETAQEAYMESTERYTKMFEDKAKYMAIMNAVCSAIYRECRNSK